MERDEADQRITINVRVSRAAMAVVEEMAAAEERNRSQMLRVLLAEAIRARRSK